MLQFHYMYCGSIWACQPGMLSFLSLWIMASGLGHLNPIE